MRQFFLALGILIGFASRSQRLPVPMGLSDVPYTGNPSYAIYLSKTKASQPLKLFEKYGLTGSPYLSETYKAGFVQLRNGYSQNDVPLRFNVFSNEMEFKLKETELVLDSMELAMYLDTPGDSSSIRMFRTGYPAINENSETTIYEVLVMGPRSHLIKRITQKIEDIKTIGYADTKVLNTYTSLYIYNPENNTISKLRDKKIEEQLTVSLPGLAPVMDKILKQKKLNLKKEIELAELLTDFNQL